MSTNKWGKSSNLLTLHHWIYKIHHKSHFHAKHHLPLRYWSRSRWLWIFFRTQYPLHRGIHSFKAIYGNSQNYIFEELLVKRYKSLNNCNHIVVWVNCRFGKLSFCCKVTKPNYRVTVSFRHTGSAHTRTQPRQGGDLWEVGTSVCVQLPSNHKLLRLQIWNWQFRKVRKNQMLRII